MGSPTQRVADKTAGACSISRSTMHQPWDRTTDPVAFPFWGPGGCSTFLVFVCDGRCNVDDPERRLSAGRQAQRTLGCTCAARRALRSVDSWSVTRPVVLQPFCLPCCLEFVCHALPVWATPSLPGGPKKGGKPVLYMY